jgi:hypothetical protein
LPSSRLSLVLAISSSSSCSVAACCKRAGYHRQIKANSWLDRWNRDAEIDYLG